MSQAGTQEDISRKFHTMVSEEKMLEWTTIDLNSEKILTKISTFIKIEGFII